MKLYLVICLKTNNKHIIMINIYYFHSYTQVGLLTGTQPICVRKTR